MQHIRVVHRERVPWAVWIMMLVCLVAGPWIFFAWNRQWRRVQPGQDPWSPNAALAARTDSWMQGDVAHEPITDVLVVLYANNKPGFAGKRVQLEQVEVRAATDQGALWVSQHGTGAVFVALPAKPPATRVEANRAVNITGTFQLVHGENEVRSKWPGLSGEQVKRLAATGSYVQADNVEVTGWY